jgi:hypothetical protein
MNAYSIKPTKFEHEMSGFTNIDNSRSQNCRLTKVGCRMLKKFLINIFN